MAITPSALLFTPPAHQLRGYAHQAVHFGKQIRDEWIWDFPLLPGAVYTYQQMASYREWRVAGPPRQVSRALEWLNNAVCYNSDGTIEYGWQPFEARRVLDYLCVGRTMFRVGDELEYLDPTEWAWDLEQRRWQSAVTQAILAPEEIVVNHPIPLGASGKFRAPLASVIPTAMLAWLIREHDRAAADGRKIRDITLVLGKDLAEQIRQSIETTLSLWNGADPVTTGVPVVYVESMAQMLKADEYVTRIGLANIPEAFNRSDFQFEYVNEIAAHTGLSLRHFWNSEKATNRALEEVQEARQTQKGPSSFTRNEQSLLRDHKVLKRKFGGDVRMQFIEEVDSQSRETDAKVVKLYAEALTQLAAVFGGTVNGDAFLGWFQAENLLPADLDLITDMGTIQDPNALPTPDGTGASVLASSNTAPRAKAFEDDLNYGEIVLDMHGKVLSRRPRIFSAAKAIAAELAADPTFADKVEHDQQPPDFYAVLDESRRRFAKIFFDQYPSADSVADATAVHPDFLKSLYATPDRLTDDQYRFIANFMMERGTSLW